MYKKQKFKELSADEAYLVYLKLMVETIYNEIPNLNKNAIQKELMSYLIMKFEKDIAKRSRLMRFILVIDQMFNVLLWNGSQDETISSHIARRIVTKKATWFDKLLCRGLGKIESKHCMRSAGE